MKQVEVSGGIGASVMQFKEMMAEEEKKHNAQPETEAEAVEESEQQAEEETEDTSETSEETEGEEEESEGSEEEEDTEIIETLTLTHKGKPIEVSVDEAIQLAQKGYDYSQKMEEMSHKVKSEAKKLSDEQTVEMDKARQSFVEKASLVESLYNQPLVTAEKLSTLREDGDWDEYHRMKDQEDSRKELLKQVKAERQKAQTEQEEEFKNRTETFRKQEIAKVQDSRPDLQGEGWADFKKTFTKEYDVKEEDFDQILTSKGYAIANDALKYRQMMGKGIEKPKKKVKTLNVTKKKSRPISKVSIAQRANNEMEAKFKQTGKTRDAAAFFKAKYLTN